MSLPYVITILVTSGDPDGVRVVEKSNWTGSGMVFARSDLGDAVGQGLASPGVYVLMGDDPDEAFEGVVGDQRKSRFRISESRGPGVRCSSGW